MMMMSSLYTSNSHKLLQYLLDTMLASTTLNMEHQMLDSELTDGMPHTTHTTTVSTTSLMMLSSMMLTPHLDAHIKVSSLELVLVML